MGISWVSVACIIQSCVIVWLTGFLCSSLRFHRQQQTEIKELKENVAHWRDWSRQAEAENAELKRDSVNNRHEHESAKRALEFFDEMRRALEKYDHGPIPF